MTGTTAEGLFGEGVAPGAAEAELVPLLTDYLDDVASSTANVLGDIAGVAVTLSVDGSPFTIGASSCAGQGRRSHPISDRKGSVSARTASRDRAVRA